MITRARVTVTALVTTALIATGCGGKNDGGTPPLIVFAAASLQGSFATLAKEFHARHPDVTVAPIRYDGSQALATQAIDGADVDVLAFASEASLKPVTAKGITDAGAIFATNTLQIAVAPGNPQHLLTLADLARPGVTTVLCAPQVPCGAAAATLLKDANVIVKPVSEETNVTSVVTRIAGGEADAGLVYATDVAAAKGKLEGITPPNTQKAINRYPIAVSTKAKSPTAAKEFVDFVTSADGRKVLAEYGFGTP